MSSSTEEKQRFAAHITDLLSSDAARAAFTKSLVAIAAQRHAKLFAALKAEGKLPPASASSSSVAPTPPPRFIDDDKNVMLYIERNKNENVVVYRGMFGPDAAGAPFASNDAEEAAAVVGGVAVMSDKGGNGGSLDAFWLDIDPAYMEANRKKGIQSNRCELNFVDRSMAYGVTVKAAKPIDSLLGVITQQQQQQKESGSNFTFADSRIFPVSFVAIPSRVFFQALLRVPVDGCAAVPCVFLPVIFAFIDGKLCVTERIYVSAKEGGLLGLPKVQHIDMFGWEVPLEATAARIGGSGGAVSVTERLTP